MSQVLEGVPARTAEPPARPAPGYRLIQRCGGVHCPPGTCDHTDDPADAVHRSADESAPGSAVPGAVLRVLDTPGSPLDSTTRADMESRLGHDFGAVRVHTDAEAARSAQSIHAQAYTFGSHVVLGAGRFQPGTPSGDRLLAHELIHVVQQSAAPAPAATAARLSDPADRFEQAAEAAATLATEPSAAPAAGPVAESAAGLAAGAVAARAVAGTSGRATTQAAGAEPVVHRREETGSPVAPSGAIPAPAGGTPATGRPTPETRTPHDSYVLDFGVHKNVMNWREVIRHVGEIEAESVDQMVRDVKAEVGDPATNCLRRLTLDGHGSPGNMSVGDGTGWIEGKNISTGSFRPSLADLKPYFCDGAQVTLLGCNVGRGAVGARFIQTLADYWQVNVAAATGLVDGFGIEGVWVWGLPGQTLPTDALLLVDQIVRIYDTSPSGDDEEMIFDLLDAGLTDLGTIRAELARLGKWDGIKTNLRDEDRSRFDLLFPGEP